MQEDNKNTKLEDLLLTFRRNIRDIIKKAGFKDELTFSQNEVLQFIGPHDKKTMRNIAEHLKITPPSATEIIAEMEKKKLIRRTSIKGDRRIVLVALSPKAKELSKLWLKRKDDIFKKMTSKLSDKDRKTLERIIRIMVTE